MNIHSGCYFFSPRAWRCVHVMWVVLGVALTLLGQTASMLGADLKSADDPISVQNDAVVIHPIHHATFIMVWKDRIIYVDPVGETQLFQGHPRPDLILITDIHDDHFSTNTLEAISAKRTIIIAPSAVADELPANLRQRTKVMTNGETNLLAGVTIEAVPMYNVTEDRRKFHEKGRGNGYVVKVGSSLFSVGDIKNISSFADKLKKKTGPVSEFLWDQFSDATRQELAAYTGTATGNESLQQTLIDELNRIIQGGSIYQAQRFAGVALSFEVKPLLGPETSGERLIRLNRVLLEDAYPMEIIKSATTGGERRVYISGDTEDIPEMRSLKNIDVAFVCMNLPSTMTVEQAASAVREFKPKVVCPYHYQGSDLEKFKKLVGDDAGVEVVLRDWYKK